MSLFLDKESCRLYYRFVEFPSDKNIYDAATLELTEVDSFDNLINISNIDNILTFWEGHAMPIFLLTPAGWLIVEPSFKITNGQLLFRILDVGIFDPTVNFISDILIGPPLMCAIDLPMFMQAEDGIIQIPSRRIYDISSQLMDAAQENLPISSLFRLQDLHIPYRSWIGYNIGAWMFMSSAPGKPARVQFYPFVFIEKEATYALKVTVDTENASQLRRENMLTDVNFIVSDGTTTRNISAHKIILANVSNYFKTLFVGPFEETGEVTINVEDTDPNLFETMIDMIYGKPVPLDDWNTILDLAILLQFFQIKSNIDEMLPRLDIPPEGVGRYIHTLRYLHPYGLSRDHISDIAGRLTSDVDLTGLRDVLDDELILAIMGANTS